MIVEITGSTNRYPLFLLNEWKLECCNYWFLAILFSEELIIA